MKLQFPDTLRDKDEEELRALLAKAKETRNNVKTVPDEDS